MKKIILVIGDPNSINVEIIYKSLMKIKKSVKSRVYLIGSYDLMQSQLKILNYSMKIIKKNEINNYDVSNFPKIIDIKTNFKNPFKVSKKDASDLIYKSLNLSHKLALRDDVLGVINCPIDKKLLRKNQYGVTEFFSAKCKLKKDHEVMLIKNENLSVCPLTTHLDLKKVNQKLNLSFLIKKIKIINSWFSKKLLFKPKIAVLGLNPHNAELRNNSEEKKIIMPAIKKLNKFGINIDGPYSADSFFIENYKKFDVVVGMFHDQVLVPFKTLFKFDGINITLGLKYLRVSPDHGTALDLIKKKKANPLSLIKCINFLDKFGK